MHVETSTFKVLKVGHELHVWDWFYRTPLWNYSIELLLLSFAHKYLSSFDSAIPAAQEFSVNLCYEAATKK